MDQGEDLFGTVFERGECVFRQGEPGETMYLVQSGAVEIVRRNGDDATVLALLEAGAYFGEMALLDSRPRSSDAVAAMRTRLVSFTRASLLDRLGKDPAVAMHLLRVFCRRIAQTNLRRSRAGIVDEPDEAGPRETRREAAVENPAHSARAALDFFLGLEESEQFQEGETLFRQGDRGDALYVILDGQVDMYDESPTGRYLLASLGAGEIIGEMSLITDQPRSATVVTTAPARLLRVSKESFLDRIAAQPQFGLALLQTLTCRLRRTLDGSPAAESAAIAQAPAGLAMKAQGRIRVGLVALSSCAGCSAVLLENPGHLTDFFGSVSIEYCSLLLDCRDIGEVDVCVVEGVVRMEHDLAQLSEARARSRYLIAWGTCAVFGGIPTLANQHDVADLVEAAYGGTDDLFSHYFSGQRISDGGVYSEKSLGLLRRAGRVDDHVRTDYYVPGCPPPAAQLAAILGELGGRATPLKKMPNICAECARKPGPAAPGEVRMLPTPGTDTGKCLLTQGTFCFGPVSRGGCAAPCTNCGFPCWGCRGPTDIVLQKIREGESFESAILATVSKRAKIGKEQLEPLVKALRIRANSILGFPPPSFACPEKMR